MSYRCWVLTVVLMSGLSVAENHEDDADNVFRVGVSPLSFSNINPQDAYAAVNIWASSVAREMEVNINFNVTIFDSFEFMKADIEQQKLDALMLLTSEFVGLNVRPETVYLQTSEQGAKVSYVLLARSDAAQYPLGTLDSRDILLYEGRQMDLASIWLERLFLEEFKRKVSPSFRTTNNASNAILEVFFNQARFSVVSREAYELAVELNPQVGREVKVIFESPLLISSLFIMHPEWKSRIRPRVEYALENLHKSIAGQQVLLVFQGGRMDSQPLSVLQDTIDFLTSNKSLEELSIR